MANKETRFLTQIDQLEADDLLPVFDLSLSDTRKEKAEKILIPQINPYSVPPSAGGYAGINVLTFFSTFMSAIDAGVEGIIVRVTALDIIKLIKGGDGTQITYGMSKDGIIWVDNIDPTLAYVDYNCSETGLDIDITGAILVFVRVQDSSYISNTIETFVVVQDPSNLCGGGGGP
jgi:hypothetical protein